MYFFSIGHLDFVESDSFGGVLDHHFAQQVLQLARDITTFGELKKCRRLLSQNVVVYLSMSSLNMKQNVVVKHVSQCCR